VNELPGLIEDALKMVLRPQDKTGTEAVDA
jgi:hypothetical protein